MLFLTAMISVPAQVGAQVTIGSVAPPQEFSVLELISNQAGLRLPQIESAAERDRLITYNSNFDIRTNRLAWGLKIFNMETQCVETWNGLEWIAACEGDVLDPCAGLGSINAYFCDDDAATIADLTRRAIDAGGRGNIVWYNAAIGGTRLDPATPLVNGATYWADNCATVLRRRVEVEFRDCSPITESSNVRIIAFTNVMYDFQHQTIETIVTSGGEATSWRWQMSVRFLRGTSGAWTNWTTDWTDWSDWHDIPGAANSARFTIPANFMYTHVGIPRGTDGQAPDAPQIMFGNYRTNVVEVRFRTGVDNPHILTLACSSYTDILSILFIRTNTSGFGGSGNERFLTVRRALYPNNMGGGRIRLALLNVGATYDDGIGLGEFIQWGRTRDGHSATHWRHITDKPIHPNPAIYWYYYLYYGAVYIGTTHPGFSGWGNTSEPVVRNRNVAGSDYYGQITNPEFANRFIVAAGAVDGLGGFDWGGGIPLANRNDLWGSGLASNRAGQPVSLDDWTARARANNPCPPGWRIPSIFDWADMHENQGVASFASMAEGFFSGTNNNWHLRDHTRFGGKQAVLGGMVITNQYGEAVFLPNVSRRIINAERFGAHGINTIHSLYWSSTHFNQDLARALIFSSLGLALGSEVMTVASFRRMYGGMVRCVQ